ncbi:MAG: hypothetical protein MJY99_02730 [Fibrobacter sp.]|nr:hypothetical protein [Fibrobacter sp.]
MMKKMFKLFLTAVMVVACAGMWGCGNSDYVHWDKRLNGVLVALVDDSLALLTNYRKFEDCHEIFMGSDECDPGITNDGLFLVNYRKKRAPLWGDTLKEHVSIVYGFWRDSSALFSNEDEKFGFWKIGEEPRVVGKWKCEAPCRCGSAKYGHPWKNGNILLKMVQQDECPYAILDTATGAVKKLEFKGEYAWLEGCDDITYIDGDVVCLRQREGGLCELDFEIDGVAVDSIIKGDWMMGNPPYFIGNAVRMPVYTWDKEDPAHNYGDRIALINKNGFERDYPETWLYSNTFTDSLGNSISYSLEDLIVTK